MKISAILSIFFISSFLIILVIAEFFMADKEHGSIYLDPFKHIMLEKFDQNSDPETVLSLIKQSIINQPFIYRQTFFLALFGSLLCTNFLYVLFPSMLRIEHFFPIFFMLIFIFFIELAFINYHYYYQKEEMTLTGLNKLQDMMISKKT